MANATTDQTNGHADMPPPPPVVGKPALVKRLSSSEHAPTDVGPHSVARRSGSLQHQDMLPKMPIPALEDTVNRFLAAVLPLLSPEAQETTKTAAAAFLAEQGPQLHEALLEYDATEENYLEHFYREIYTGAGCSNYSLNPNFTLFPEEGSTDVAMAAKLLSATLQHYVAIRDGMFAPMTRGRNKDPLCMRQMPWIHGQAKIARENTVDELQLHIDNSKHIVVFCNSCAFKITVVGPDNNLIASTALLEQRLAEVKAQAAALPSKAVGALTTLPRTDWKPLRAKMEADPMNMASLEAIDTALAIVCLDPVSGLSAEQMELNVLYGVDNTFGNRWMDKWNIIVCEDGQAGLNWEHSMLDGHTMMEFFADIANGYQAEPPVTVDAGREGEVVAEHLDFNIDASTVATIESAKAKGKELSDACGVESLEFADFGASFIKGCKCSPDGFTQAALTIAYYNLRGRLPVPYESVLVKAFKHGRVTVARNMSQTLADKVMEFQGSEGAAKIEAFKAIVGEVGRVCKEAASAADWDRPMFCYKTIAKHMDMEVPLFTDAGMAAMGDIDLCTSHCGRPPIRLFGFEPPAADGYGVGYYVDAAKMQFSINHFDKALAAQYKEALAATLRDLQALFSA